MGCNSSKSTPVVESNGTTGQSASSNSLIHKGGEIMHQVASDIKDKAADLTHKVESFVCDSKGSPTKATPETQRAQMADDGDDGTRQILGDADEQNSTVPMRIISIDVDEDNQQELRDNQVPVKMSVSLGDTDDQVGAVEKPPTPMPEGRELYSHECDNGFRSSNNAFDQNSIRGRTRHSLGSTAGREGEADSQHYSDNGSSNEQNYGWCTRSNDTNGNYNSLRSESKCNGSQQDGSESNSDFENESPKNEDSDRNITVDDNSCAGDDNKTQTIYSFESKSESNASSYGGNSEAKTYGSRASDSKSDYVDGSQTGDICDRGNADYENRASGAQYDYANTQDDENSNNGNTSKFKRDEDNHEMEIQDKQTSELRCDCVGSQDTCSNNFASENRTTSFSCGEMAGESSNEDNEKHSSNYEQDESLKCDFQDPSYIKDQNAENNQNEIITSKGRLNIVKDYICLQWNKGIQKKNTKQNNIDECEINKKQFNRGSLPIQRNEQNNLQGTTDKLNTIKDYVCTQWNENTQEKDTKQDKNEEYEINEDKCDRSPTSIQCDQQDTRHSQGTTDGLNIVEDYVCSQWNKNTQKRDIGPDKIGQENTEQNNVDKYYEIHGDQFNCGSLYEQCDEQGDSQGITDGINIVEDYVGSGWNINTKKWDTKKVDDEECGADDNPFNRGSLSTECNEKDHSHGHKKIRNSGCLHTEEGNSNYNSFSIQSNINSDLYSYCNEETIPSGAAGSKVDPYASEDSHSEKNGQVEDSCAPEGETESNEDLYETLNHKTGCCLRSGLHEEDNGESEKEIYLPRYAESVESVASESWTQPEVDGYERRSRTHQTKSTFIPCILNLNFDSALAHRDSICYSDASTMSRHGEPVSCH